MNKNSVKSVAFASIVIMAYSGVALAGSYSGPNGTAVGRRANIEPKITDEAIAVIQGNQGPSEALKSKLEEKRTEMASVVGPEAAKQLSYETLAALLVSEN
jgi:hypothetical protein